MNIPNLLTLSRIALAIIIPFYLLSPSLTNRVIAFGLFVIAAFTDLFDGRISRKYNLVTTFGKIMDPIADKALIITAFVCLWYLGLFPFWILIPIFIRELLVTAHRLYLLTKGKAVAAERAGKIKAVAQFITLALLYSVLLYRDYYNYLPDSLGLTLNVLVYMSFTIVISLTLYSGTIFFMKNWK